MPWFTSVTSDTRIFFTLVTMAAAMNNSGHHGHQNYDQSEIFW